MAAESKTVYTGVPRNKISKGASAMMRRISLGFVLVFCLAVPAFAAGQFDGEWNGELVVRRGREEVCGVKNAHFNAHIENNQFIGITNDSGTRRTFKGEISPEGNLDAWSSWRLISSRSTVSLSRVAKINGEFTRPRNIPIFRGKLTAQLPVKSVTVVLEACFSGAAEGGALISNASPVYLKAKTPAVPPNVTVIAAGATNRMASWEKDKSHGLFTKYFLIGMSGEADAKPLGNEDGHVDYGELDTYLKYTPTYCASRYYGRDQTAQIVIGKPL